MNAIDIINERFIQPLMSKKTGNVGVELEFPMLNMNKKPIDEKIALGLLEYFLNNGFTIAETTISGQPVFIENADGDVISFDNSYNNIEFSMQYGDNLLKIKSRFKKYFSMAQEYLKPFNYLITGMGTNPYKRYIKQSHVDFPVYNMVDEFLNAFANDETHEFPDFPAYLSSVQTHLDISPEKMAMTANLMSQIGFIRAILLSNSPDFEFSGKFLCYRDFLWENSAFGTCNKNTGKVDEKFLSLKDIVNSYLDRSMFNRIRNGKYEIFEPVLLMDYFEKPKYNADKKDIEQFLSFRDVEITARGTLEVRGDCAQPLHEAFVPPAFALGLAHNVDKANESVEAFFKQFWLKGKNSVLRNKAVRGKSIKGIYDFDIKDFSEELVRISEQGLKNRGKGEEVLLKPLYERVQDLMCPASHTLDRLSQGENIDDIIIDYSRLDK